MHWTRVVKGTVQMYQHVPMLLQCQWISRAGGVNVFVGPGFQRFVLWILPIQQRGPVVAGGVSQVIRQQTADLELVAELKGQGGIHQFSLDHPVYVRTYVHLSFVSHVSRQQSTCHHAFFVVLNGNVFPGVVQHGTQSFPAILWMHADVCTVVIVARWIVSSKGELLGDVLEGVLRMVEVEVDEESGAHADDVSGS